MIGLKKVSGEGTSSPFTARLFSGMLELRNLLVLSNTNPLNYPITREEFDKLYNPIFLAMQATKDAAQRILEIIESHKTGISTGRLVKFQKDAFAILETVDNRLGQELGKLLDNGIIAAKDQIQHFLKQLFNIDISFLYHQKEIGYKNGITALRSKGEGLYAEYLEQVRGAWLKEFQDLRNKREHEGWTLRPVEYIYFPPVDIQAIFPNVLGDPIDVFARRSANRVLLFVENVIAYGFQLSGRLPVYLVEIPIDQRDPGNCRRFQAMPKMPGFGEIWRISYQDEFDFI